MLAGRIARETCQSAVMKVGGGEGLVVTPMDYIASKEDNRGSLSFTSRSEITKNNCCRRD